MHLGKLADVLRSHTTLFASTFHALIPPSAVPMSNYLSQELKDSKIMNISHYSTTIKETVFK